VPPKLLKWLRVMVAVAVFAALIAAFVDFRGQVPSWVGHRLAEIQFVPSLVALLAGASLSLACIIIAIVTLVVGRIYCSAICPLGILQDMIIRLTQWWERKSKPAPFVHPCTWSRQMFLWAAVIAAVVGWGGSALSLLDPYSNFGRIASDIFRPLITLANNSVVGLTEAIGWHGLFRAVPIWAGAGALAVPVFMLVLIVALAAWRGRLYCNTVCPVGTVLGWLSQRAAFRLQIDQSACRKCAACLRACKAQCIDLRAGAIDFSRCVACYNCMGVCDQHGINYRFAWTRKTSIPTPDPQGTRAEVSGGARASARLRVGNDWMLKIFRLFSFRSLKRRERRAPSPARVRSLLVRELTGDLNAVSDPQRRAFISKTIVGIAGTVGISRVLLANERQPDGSAGGSQDHSPVICPPGTAGVKRFLDRCTACHLCISECPTGVLQPAFLEYGLLGLMKPRMDYRVAFCNFDCRRCGEVCPDGTIDLLDLAAKHLAKIGEAHFDKDKCVVVTNGTDCAACSEHCPTKAVITIPYGNNLRLPSLNDDLCIGCGACEYACPARPDKAITVTGLREHSWAKKLIEPKATLPKSAGDFPF
jgi:ferredoxin